LPGRRGLKTSAPAAYLPHRHPFLLIDRLLAREPDASASALVRVSQALPAFPAVLLVEAMAQVAGIAAGHAEGEGGFLAAINHAEFHGSAAPGDSLRVTARIVTSFGRLRLVHGEVHRDDRPLAAATLALGIGPLG